jgi:hypothetical protein
MPHHLHPTPTPLRTRLVMLAMHDALCNLTDLVANPTPTLTSNPTLTLPSFRVILIVTVPNCQYQYQYQYQYHCQRIRVSGRWAADLGQTGAVGQCQCQWKMGCWQMTHLLLPEDRNHSYRQALWNLLAQVGQASRGREKVLGWSTLGCVDGWVGGVGWWGVLVGCVGGKGGVKMRGGGVRKRSCQPIRQDAGSHTHANRRRLTDRLDRLTD